MLFNVVFLKMFFKVSETELLGDIKVSWNYLKEMYESNVSRNFLKLNLSRNFLKANQSRNSLRTLPNLPPLTTASNASIQNVYDKHVIQNF